MEGKNSVFNIKRLLSYSPLQEPIPVLCEDLSPTSLYWVGCSERSHLDKIPELGPHGGRWWNSDMLADLLMSYTGLHKAIFMFSYKWKLVSLLNCGDGGKKGRRWRLWTVGRCFLSSASYSTLRRGLLLPELWIQPPHYIPGAPRHRPGPRRSE